MSFMTLDLARTLVAERAADAELRTQARTARGGAARSRVAPQHRRVRRLTIRRVPRFGVRVSPS